MRRPSSTAMVVLMRADVPRPASAYLRSRTGTPAIRSNRSTRSTRRRSRNTRPSRSSFRRWWTIYRHRRPCPPRRRCSVTSPAPGQAAVRAEVYDAMRMLEKASPRVKVFSIGTTEEGREMIAVAIASEAVAWRSSTRTARAWRSSPTRARSTSMTPRPTGWSSRVGARSTTSRARSTRPKPARRRR